MEIFTYKETPSSLLSPFLPSVLSNQIAPETDSHGAIEYKLHMIRPAAVRLEQLTTQLQWRLTQGQGQAIYEIGVSDDGTLVGLLDSEMYGSLRTLKRMARSVGAWFKVVRVIPVDGNRVANDGRCDCGRRVVEVHVYKKAVEKDLVKMFVVGSAGTGKSSLLGTLCYDGLDNGRGKARTKVLKHRHELVSGRTSSVGIDVFGYSGSVARTVSSYTTKFTCDEIVAVSSRVVMAFDTPGALNKLGLVCRNLALYRPHVTVVTVTAGARWAEYVDLALRSTGRVAILLTKSDKFTSTDELKSLLRSILVLIAAFSATGNLNSTEDIGSERQLFGKMVNSNSVAVECANSDTCVPVFLVSAVSGSGISYLHQFVNALQVDRLESEDETEPEDLEPDSSLIPRDHLLHHTSSCVCTAAVATTKTTQAPDYPELNFYITSVFDSGRILTGVVRRGTLALGHTYYIGSGRGKFAMVVIQSMQKLRVPCLELREGEIGSIGIQLASRAHRTSASDVKLQRGMTVLSSKLQPATEIFIELNADIHVGAAIVVYSGFERLAEVVSVDDRVRARFVGRGEFVCDGMCAIVRVQDTNVMARLYNIGNG